MAVKLETTTSTPASSDTGSSTSPRRRPMSWAVASSCGPVVGMANQRAMSPSSDSTGPATNATPSADWTASVMGVSDAGSVPSGTSATRNSGPLKPGPNPSLSRS